jgi:hypothetical protein
MPLPAQGRCRRSPLRPSAHPLVAAVPSRHALPLPFTQHHLQRYVCGVFCHLALSSGHVLAGAGVVQSGRWSSLVSSVMWCDVVWCGVVRCGAVRCGVVWCGVVWCGVVWCGVVRCGVVQWRGAVVSCV